MDVTSPDARPSAARTLVAIALGVLPIVAMSVGGWQWWQGRQQPLVSGDLGALAVEPAAAAGARSSHPLLEVTEPERWMRSADAEALGRDGSHMIQDVRRAIDPARAPSPVAVTGLRSGLLAWASPRQVRIVHPGRRGMVARVDPCGSAVHAVTVASQRLVVAACGRVQAFGATGRVRWTHRLDGEGGVAALAVVGERVIVHQAATAGIAALEAGDGRLAWSSGTAGVVTAVEPVGHDRIAVATRDGEVATITLLSTTDGVALWSRRWQGWAATALGSDRRRVVAGLARTDGERCAATGLTELSARTGATTATAVLDRRHAVGHLRHDPATGRMVAVLDRRDCTLAYVEPLVSVYGARGLVRVGQQPLPSRSCSNLAVGAGLAAVATCEELVAIDTLEGRTAWSVPLPDVGARTRMAVSVGAERVLVSDDAGTLLAYEAPAP